MILRRISLIVGTAGNLLKVNGQMKIHVRSRITTPSGAILPEPKRPRFSFLGVICSVTIGLITGATMSKIIANFLEEKELFVPSDDDDDDD
ncbi:essential MCU regulator, mitochondrial [Osmia bicornis bicornis]|uniref:essential MCU regulator, mitochondrial n=1 Tax=Osmia bicornis bicornis TaxID=1437191 RepID=UPI0010F453B0|nr:essential MCU regulator, mitochondrial [Osmia bicornis bicornis]XP_029054569.1 essential MCU regulator, mitochondrial [Osmia bicornis bicornis]